MSDIKYIAVVDDHPMFRKGLAGLINIFSDYQVLFDAGNGKEFIALLEPEKLPDIVLLDITMPEMDGYQTCSWLKENYPDIKVLALSMMDSDAAIIKMIKCGAKGYILKDADIPELRLAFSELLRFGFFYNEIVTRRVIQSIDGLIDTNSSLAGSMRLSENELLFLKLSCSEKTYQQIAREMFKSEKTIDGYRAEVFRKLNVTSRVGMVMYALKNGLVSGF